MTNEKTTKLQMIEHQLSKRIEAAKSIRSITASRLQNGMSISSALDLVGDEGIAADWIGIQAIDLLMHLANEVHRIEVRGLEKRCHQLRQELETEISRIMEVAITEDSRVLRGAAQAWIRELQGFLGILDAPLND